MSENSDPQLLPASTDTIANGGGVISKATRVFGNVLTNDDVNNADENETSTSITVGKPSLEPPVAEAVEEPSRNSTESTGRLNTSSSRTSNGSDTRASTRSSIKSTGSSSSSSATSVNHTSPDRKANNADDGSNSNNKSSISATSTRAASDADSLCYSPSPLLERLQLTDKTTTPRDLFLGGSGTDANEHDDDNSSTASSSSTTTSSSSVGSFGRRQAFTRSNSAPALGTGTRTTKTSTAGGAQSRRNLVANVQRNITRGGRPAAAMTSYSHSSSVNQSINAARSAKQSHLRTHQSKMAQVRTERQEQKMDAASFHAEAERMRREALSMQRQLSAKFAKARAQREAAVKANRLSKITEEVEFKGRVYRDHQLTNKEIEDRRRRKSSQVKSSIWAERRANGERMKLEQIEEDRAWMEERNLGSVAAREYARQEAEKRRQSMAFRNMEAHRIRDEEEQRRAEEMHNQSQSIQLKLAGEQDADDYRRQMAEERRRSLAFRNAEGSRIREEEEQRRVEALRADHESIELKLAGESDADAYRRAMAEERRQSFAFRNAEGRRIREEEEQRRAEEMHGEHQSFELKFAGERDADEYRKQMAEERRKSYEFRHREGHRQREEAEQRRAEEMAAESDSIQLKLAGERDADAYRKQMAEERRKDFEFRHREGHRQREEAEQRRAEEMAAESDSIQLRLAGERDADAYRKQCAEDRRLSYELRNAEGRRQWEEEAQRRAEEMVAESESIQLKLAGERDADGYRKQLAEERRQSLAFRNREGAKHRAVMEELHTLVQQQEHESFMLKWAGEKDAEAYLAEEEDKRRESLRLRNAEGRRHREIEEDEHCRRIQEQAEDEKLKAAGDRDVQAYREQCAARDRASLQYQLKESRIQRMEEANRKQIEYDHEQTNLKLEEGARRDVEEYVESCKRRRRLSLAFRAKEKRRHFEHQRTQRERSILRRNAATRDRAVDANFVQLAQQKERAEQALLNLQHRSRLNPFGSVL